MYGELTIKLVTHRHWGHWRIQAKCEELGIRVSKLVCKKSAYYFVGGPKAFLRAEQQELLNTLMTSAYKRAVREDIEESSATKETE